MPLSDPWNNTPPQDVAFSAGVAAALIAAGAIGPSNNRVVVATAHMALSSILENVVVDGQTLQGTGADVVLLTAQNTPSENGLYVVDTSAPPPAAAGTIPAIGQAVRITHGTVNAGKVFRRTGTNTWELFAEFSNTAPVAATI